MLHNNVPGALVDRVEVPLQLLTTVTTGVARGIFGTAVPVPGKLVHPSSVLVTV